jgi:uncharacterized membrane protein YhaH (DUF805 family)
MEGCIFINYRRQLSGSAAGRLTDRLFQHFDRERLFIDVDGIEPGVDFIKELDDQLARCGAFIAVIGPGWTDLKNTKGQRRLDQPNDHVRVEIEAALKRDIRVIPVLVDGASMPAVEELPDSLKPLSRRNAVTLSNHRFGSEVDELARALQRALGLHPKSNATYAFANRTIPAPSWTDFLFSFEGRIPRKSFWLSGLSIMGVCILVELGLAVVLGPDALTQKGAASSKLMGLYTIATLPFYWPSLALYQKRLHDFGQGKGWFWLGVIAVVPSVLSLASDSNIQLLLAVPALIGILIVGSIKGTPGSNQYGPDPLVNIARKSAA